MFMARYVYVYIGGDHLRMFRNSSTNDYNYLFEESRKLVKTQAIK